MVGHTGAMVARCTPSTPQRSRWRLPVAVAVVTLLVAGCAARDRPGGPGTLGWAEVGSVAAPDASGPQTPAEGQASPGTRTAPSGWQWWRVGYGTTNASGGLVTATGMIAAPGGEPPPGGRPVVVWGHPTRGLADRCAPSREGPGTIPVLAAMLEAGWVVVAPDYEGLGGDGLHPYGVGASAGRSLLDAVRAAVDVPAAGVLTTSPVVLFGFSQGGQAAAFAAQMAPVAAPNIDLRGVAVVNPVADVASFVVDATTRPDQFGVVVSVVAGMETTYPGVRLADVLAGGAPAAARARALLARDCIGDVVEAFGGDPARYVGTPIGDLPALDAALAANRTGGVTADAPALDVPALVVQGSLDDVVRPAETAALVERWCAQGAPVQSVVVSDADHGLDASGEVLPWIAARFAGANPPDDCAPRS